MVRTRELILIVILMCISLSNAQTSKTQVFSIQKVELRAGERIVGSEVNVTAGAFRSIANLPVGWYWTIDNDASWQTKIKANARVGSASLDATSLQAINIGVMENEFGDLKFGLAGTLVVTTDFAKERRIPLAIANFISK